MKLKYGCIAAMLLMLLTLAGCSGGGPDASPTEEPTAATTPEPTPTPVPTPTPTPIPPELLFEITVVPPSCQANGYSQYVSRETGAINIRDEVPRLNHDYSPWTIDMDTGAMVRTCSMCGGTDRRRADGLARLILSGDAEALEQGQGAMEVRFIDPREKLAFTGYGRVLWPGYSRESRRKCDLNVTFYDDADHQKPHDFELIDGLSLSTYTLAANTIDASQLRHAICAALWKRMGEGRAACESIPVTLYLNGDFRGLYALTVPPGAALYGMEAGQRQAVVTAASGAFLGGTDWQVLFNGQADDAWIKEELEALEAFIRDSDDATFHEQLRAYLDTDTAIDYLLFMYTMGLNQSASKDIALLKYDYDPFVIAPFDMSEAFNLSPDGEPQEADVFLPARGEDGAWHTGTGSPLWDRLMNVFSEDIARRWQALRQDALSEAFITRWMRYSLRRMPANVYRADRSLFRRSALITDPGQQMQDFIHQRLVLLDAILGETNQEADP